MFRSQDLGRNPHRFYNLDRHDVMGLPRDVLVSESVHKPEGYYQEGNHQSQVDKESNHHGSWRVRSNQLCMAPRKFCCQKGGLRCRVLAQCPCNHGRG